MIKNLKQQKGEYEQKKQMLEAELQNNNTEAGRNEEAVKIEDLEKKVYNLKHFGPDVKKMFTEIKNEGQNSKRYGIKEETVPTGSIKKQKQENACTIS